MASYSAEHIDDRNSFVSSPLQAYSGRVHFKGLYFCPKFTSLVFIEIQFKEKKRGLVDTKT